MNSSENMIEEKPIYIWQYAFKTKFGIEYSFYLGREPYTLENQELVGVVKVPLKYLPIAKIELQNAPIKKLGDILCTYTNLWKRSVRLEHNIPLTEMSDAGKNTARNTGFGSYLLLIAGAHLKKLGIRKIQSIYLLSHSGKAQLDKAGLERAESYKLKKWQRGIAKNIRLAKKRLI